MRGTCVEVQIIYGSVLDGFDIVTTAFLVILHTFVSMIQEFFTLLRERS